MKNNMTWTRTLILSFALTLTFVSHALTDQEIEEMSPFNPRNVEKSFQASCRTLHQVVIRHSTFGGFELWLFANVDKRLSAVVPLDFESEYLPDLIHLELKKPFSFEPLVSSTEMYYLKSHAEAVEGSEESVRRAYTSAIWYPNNQLPADLLNSQCEVIGTLTQQ